MKNRSIYESTDNIGFKSDIARYEILYKYGGIYIDTDFECLKKIPDKFLHFDFISCIGFNYSPVILNGFLMASPKSNFIKARAEFDSAALKKKFSNKPKTHFFKTTPKNIKTTYTPHN